PGGRGGKSRGHKTKRRHGASSRSEGDKRVARLDNKVALVTGAGRGIGRAMAVRLAQEGAHVVVADLDTRLAEETAAQVTALGRTGLALQVDVVRRPDLERMVQRSVAALGRIDI